MTAGLFPNLRENGGADDHNGHTVLEGPSIPLIFDLHISASGVKNLLLTINPTKAGGPDTIPCRFLMELAEELAPMLTLIFRQSV